MHRSLSKAISCLLAGTVCCGILGIGKPVHLMASAATSTDNRIRVDLNANDGRKASYTKTCYNWIVAGETPTATFQDVSFQLSNGGSVGQGIRSVNCKLLQKMDGSTPTMTMDGVTIKDGDSNGIIRLDIKGLSAGTHSLTTWHSCVDNATISTMSVSINGKTTATGIQSVTRVTNDDDAGMSYSTFQVKAGETVTVLIQPEGNGAVNNAFLNAFELDGADPFRSISRISPKDGEKHQEIEKALSWTAGEGAKSHDVYIGTDFSSVANADKNAPEYKGNQTETNFSLDDSYSSVNTYYWRVDEISDAGITKGAVYKFQTARLAFPTAEGYGRYARGGRGGRIVEVTNLNDSGEGSLRQALEVEKGPRIVVFRVGGVIALEKALVIPDDGGDVYVAGQTAPGDGITLINYDFGGMGSEDVIIRDVRVRVGDRNGKATGGMGLGSCNHSIVDHCSISWATDEGFSSRSAQNISFQWNIIGESLNESVHYNADDRNQTEPHSFAASISGYTGSFHHNLLINNTGRNWSLAGAMEQDAKTYGGQLDISNNVVYNWRDRTTDGGVRRLNFTNNYYKAGAVSNTDLHVVSLDGNELGTNDMQKMYVSGNKMTKSDGSVILDSSDDAWAKGKAKSGGKNSTNADVRSDTPFFDSHVNVESADDAYQKVIVSAGANQPGHDYIDSRYLKEVSTGTYTYTGSKAGLKGIVDSQNDAGGYPNASNFKGSTAPADSDHDGMPDDWETAHGLNPNNAADGSIVSLSADDYTNVEMYLNELAGDPVEFNGKVETISAFETIEAENYADQSGIRVEDCSEGGQNVGYIENGDYIVFRNVDFADGAKSFTARVSGGKANIELYLDKLGDKPAAILNFDGSGSWQDWTDASCNIQTITDVHDIYLRFTGGEGYLLNLNHFVFGKNILPQSGKLIRNLTVADTENASDWKLTTNAAVGSVIFGDRDFTFTSFASGIPQNEMIQTACDSKNCTTELGSFTAGEDIVVFIALDRRVENIPDWMQDWQKTAMTCTSSNDVTFQIYQKHAKKGQQISLGSNGQSYQCVNYVVFAAPAETTSMIGDINQDGLINTADAVFLQRYLLNIADFSEAQWNAADIHNDKKVNGLDLAALRALLLEI